MLFFEGKVIGVKKTRNTEVVVIIRTLFFFVDRFIHTLNNTAESWHY